MKHFLPIGTRIVPPTGAPLVVTATEVDGVTIVAGRDHRPATPDAGESVDSTLGDAVTDDAAAGK